MAQLHLTNVTFRHVRLFIARLRFLRKRSFVSRINKPGYISRKKPKTFLTMPIATGRILRDIKAILTFPVWLATQRVPPDNHLYKINRIKRIGKLYSCQTLIETGTFYGQTVNATRKTFQQIMSVEVYEPLYQYNRWQFEKTKNVSLFFGDSVDKLPGMIGQATGRILYWLDGHCSGDGTGAGSQVCPVINELECLIRLNRTNDCILIDDKRLFGTDPSYPTLSETEKVLKRINPDYIIVYDSDCLIALPPSTS